MEFGKVLRALRERSKMTQKQLADSLGVSIATISLYELQERMPSADILISVSEYFHVSVVLRNKNQKYLKQMKQRKAEAAKQEGASEQKEAVKQEEDSKQQENYAHEENGK